MLPGGFLFFVEVRPGDGDFGGVAFGGLDCDGADLFRDGLLAVEAHVARGLAGDEAEEEEPTAPEVIGEADKSDKSDDESAKE